jgi:hypothetical protein
MCRKDFNFLVLFIFLNLIENLLMSQQPPSQWDYQFPLDIAPKVSGSFGELRTNHFHSGLDIATQGKTGFPVHAADSGFVSRVMVSPGGFGRAVYINHPSGYTSVYGHLDKFVPRIDSIVTKIQYEEESFKVDLSFDKNEIVVKRGEVIGYSGNSGSSGGPHLHFEVRRTRDERPVDPLVFPNPVKDDVRPYIYGIKVYPLSEDATINGAGKAMYYPAVFYNGAFHLKGNPVISASGIIGVGINVIDYYSGSWRKCGVHSILLSCDDRPVFKYQMDGFYFRDTRYINSYIDYAEKVTTGRTIQKSYVDPFNKIDLYQTNERHGKLKMLPGKTYQLVYVVTDINGNKSTMEFPIKGDEMYVSKDSIEDEKKLVIDASKPFFFEKDGYSVSFDRGSFYRNIDGNIELRKSFISLAGGVFSILDKTIPVHKPFEIKIPFPDTLDMKGVCGATFSNNLVRKYAGGYIDGSYFVIKTRVCGEYFLTRDTVLPDVILRNPPHQMNYQGRKEIVVKVKDDFSGIESYEGRIDGKWALFEYDIKNEEIICILDQVPFLKKGKHELVITAADGVGNTNTLRTNFRY